jgi:hypothetical protein
MASFGPNGLEDVFFGTFEQEDAQKGRSARPQRAKRRRRTLRYVELLSEARTMLVAFFSILRVEIDVEVRGEWAERG